MNEARKFIRYIFPGTIFLVLLICYLSLSAEDNFIEVASRFIQRAKNGGGIFQAGVFVLLVSVAGYLFATIYYCVSKILGWGLPDHSGFLKDARKKNWLIVYNRSNEGDVTSTKEYPPSEAWSILGAYYHARIYKNEFAQAHNRIESLNDTLHGLGASFVGSIFAFLAWIPLHYKFDDQFPDPFFLLIPFIVSAILLFNYRRTGKEVQNFIDGIVAEFMAKESNNGESPIPIYFPA
jgi:hypothetical protein